MNTGYLAATCCIILAIVVALVWGRILEKAEPAQEKPATGINLVIWIEQTIDEYYEQKGGG